MPRGRAPRVHIALKELRERKLVDVSRVGSTQRWSGGSLCIHQRTTSTGALLVRSRSTHGVVRGTPPPPPRPPPAPPRRSSPPSASARVGLGAPSASARHPARAPHPRHRCSSSAGDAANAARIRLSAAETARTVSAAPPSAAAAPRSGVEEVARVSGRSSSVASPEMSAAGAAARASTADDIELGRDLVAIATSCAWTAGVARSASPGGRSEATPGAAREPAPPRRR